MGSLPVRVEINIDSDLKSSASFVIETILAVLGSSVSDGSRSSSPGNVMQVIYGRELNDGHDPAITIPFERAAWDQPVLPRPGFERIPGRRAVAMSHDVVASAFWFLSGLDEHRLGRLDDLGRVPYTESIFTRLGISPLIAPVNSVIAAFRLALEALAVDGPRPVYPGSRRFAVGLSHDIDALRRWTPRGYAVQASRILRAASKRDGLGAREAARSTLAALPHVPLGEDPFWTIPKIVQTELRHEARSTFFIKTAFTHSFDGADRRSYFRLLPRAIAIANDSGSEIGVHGTHLAATSGPELRRQAALVAKYSGSSCRGNRFHNLRFLPGITEKVIGEAGLQYDSSLGFAEQEGFRRGITFPHFVYDPVGRTAVPVLEIPLALMDTTLIADRYRYLEKEDAWAAITSVLGKVKLDGGAVAILWHNDQIDGSVTRGLGGLYEQMVEWIVTEGGWATTVGELAEYWIESKSRPAALLPTNLGSTWSRR